MRVAGLFDDNQINRVHSINAPSIKPFSHTRSERVTVRFDPTPNIDIIGSYQHFINNSQFFTQVESANFAVPSAAASPTTLTPGDRASVADRPQVNRTAFDIFNLQAQWKFAGQKLNFVMEHANVQLWSRGVNDTGNFFGTNYPGDPFAANDPYTTTFSTTPNLQSAGQFTRSTANQRTYELRLSSDERLFGTLDYVLGGMIKKDIVPFNLWSQTPLFAFFASPATFATFSNSNIVQTGGSIERSVFGNVTAHLGSATEISGGLRYISYKTDTAKTLQTSAAGAANPLPGNVSDNLHATIYSASIKHRFNENIMIYASTGSSWRASAQTNGIIDGISGLDRFPWGVVAAGLHLDPERSKSYEVGVKTDWLDKRMHLNLTYYHQDFTNYFYSAPLIQIAQRVSVPAGGSLTGPNAGDVYAFQTLAIVAVDVPAKVDGVEGEFSFQANRNWNIGATVSYSVSKIKNASVPCNVPVASAFFGTNGAAFVAANGGQQYGTCLANFRAGNSAPFSASIQSEYTHQFSGNIGAFIRGLLTINGNSKNDPTNPIDDIPGYALFNLYLGVRGNDGMWELTGYAKNLFNTQRVLTRDANPLSTSYTALLLNPITHAVTGAVGGAGTTTYRQITMTPPREFGVTLRLAFGSR